MGIFVYDCVRSDFAGYRDVATSHYIRLLRPHLHTVDAVADTLLSPWSVSFSSATLIVGIIFARVVSILVGAGV